VPDVFQPKLVKAVHGGDRVIVGVDVCKTGHGGGIGGPDGPRHVQKAVLSGTAKGTAGAMGLTATTYLPAGSS